MKQVYYWNTSLGKVKKIMVKEYVGSIINKEKEYYSAGFVHDDGEIDWESMCILKADTFETEEECLVNRLKEEIK
jgi:hypothetical protein